LAGWSGSCGKNEIRPNTRRDGKRIGKEENENRIHNDRPTLSVHLEHQLIHQKKDERNKAHDEREMKHPKKIQKRREIFIRGRIGEG
jgi:hypothetical protein